MLLLLTAADAVAAFNTAAAVSAAAAAGIEHVGAGAQERAAWVKGRASAPARDRVPAWCVGGHQR
jgi:hypothetical protein